MTQTISRRFFLAATGAGLLAPRIARSAEQVPTLLDHILLGCNDLDRGIAFVEKHTGVRAAFGGVHPGAGTQNALLSLGTNRYLEIIAPDPKQPASADARDLKELTDDPLLVGWAAHPGNLNAFAAGLKRQGLVIEGPMPGSRKRPDGRVLTWKVVRLKDEPTTLLPFFIEWSADSIHPSIDSPQGCHLLRFAVSCPDPASLTRMADQIGLDLSISESRLYLLRAIIAGPKGRLDLTS